MDLNAVTGFATVVANNGYAAAARATGRPKSTLSRRVRVLEEELGVRLIDRNSRTFRLTVEGGELYERTAPALSDLREVEQTLLSKSVEPTGRLRISAPTLFGTFYLGRLAARYYAAYPKVSLEIVVSDRAVDLVGEGFDAAIRVNGPENPDIERLCFAQCCMQLVASPAVAARTGRLSPAKPNALPTVFFDNFPVAPPWRFVRNKRALCVAPREIMRLSTLAMVRDAVLEGAGFSMLPNTLVADDFASGRLVYFGDLDGVDVELAIVHPSSRLMSQRLRVFIKMLVETFPDGRKPLPSLINYVQNR